MERTGGYDDGYRACSCFWGHSPGTLVRSLEDALLDASGASFAALRIVDLGCGEGKNAAYLAQQGGLVTAIDISPFAILNARTNFGHVPGVTWHCEDVQSFAWDQGSYDVVIAYGLLHCLASQPGVARVISRMQAATVAGGYNLICAFNDRHTDMTAHPGFQALFLPHEAYLDSYPSWDLLVATDSDLHETHPHNNIPHVHSMTRLLARKPSAG